MEGKGPSQIAALLEKEKVLNPTAYKQREGRKTPHQTPENEYRWHESTVAYILEYMEYTGCTVNFKTYTNSIYDKKQRENPMENRRIFYNTHPAIISLEVFDKVQEIQAAAAPQNSNRQEQYVLRRGVLQRLQAEALLLHHQLF